MSDDLVERVARAIALAYDYGGDERWLEMAFHSNVSKKRYPAQARAAIALVLEEAADAVGEVGDHAEVGAYINAVRALVQK